MVRTKADNCARKAVAAKAPRKVLGSSNSGGSSSSRSSSARKKGRYSGGNPLCVRPTPKWQKGISSFMTKLPDTDVDADGENQPDTDVIDETSAADCGPSGQPSSSSSGVDTSTADSGNTSTADSGDDMSSPRCNGIIDSDKEED